MHCHWHSLNKKKRLIIKFYPLGNISNSTKKKNCNYISHIWCESNAVKWLTKNALQTTFIPFWSMFFVVHCSFFFLLFYQINRKTMRIWKIHRIFYRYDLVQYCKKFHAHRFTVPSMRMRWVNEFVFVSSFVSVSLPLSGSIVKNCSRCHRFSSPIVCVCARDKSMTQHLWTNRLASVCFSAVWANSLLSISVHVFIEKSYTHTYIHTQFALKQIFVIWFFFQAL